MEEFEIERPEERKTDKVDTQVYRLFREYRNKTRTVSEG